MVQELAATQEFTAETMNRMEELELALTSFVEETSAALLNNNYDPTQQQQPKPPSIPPPGALLDDPWQQEKPRDLATDLAQAGTTLELLQERLRFEEEALLQAETAFQEVYDDEDDYNEDDYNEDFPEQISYQDENIMLQAEEALRKSREAAEKRRIEAEKRSVNAAMLSAGYRKQQLEEQVQEQEEKVERLQEEQAEMEAFVNYDEEIPGLNVPRTTKRPTIELGSLFGNAIESSRISQDQASEGIPTLYNWVQDEDGSITGNIKGSTSFRDGAKISTSCVLEEAEGGIIVATESGSRYFLEAEEELYETRTAPEGVPTVKSWEVREGGGIIGLIYNSPYADDGDYIETSPIADGEIDSYSVVSTESGSRYFLSGDAPEDSTETISAFRDETIQGRSTITLPKENTSRKQGRSTFSLFDKVRKQRSTFSLFDLFEENPKSKNRAMYLRDSPPKPLPPPTPDKIPPEGTPILTGCTFNADGSITGYVFGSQKIDNGVLITTSPIVYGEREQFETVTTASGSLYYLG